MRIRQTIYEDPGNPFADEVESEELSADTRIPVHKPLPPAPPIQEEESSRKSSLDLEAYQQGMDPRVSPTVKKSIANPEASHTPALPHQAESSAISAHRRSKSVAVPLSRPTGGSDEYVAPRTFWRKASVPTSRTLPHGESVRETGRDTKFYGFYDDILESYKGRESRM